MVNHFSIVPHPSEPRVLVVADGAHWALPSHETEDAEAIRDLMLQRFGLHVTVLGAYAGHFTDAEHDVPAFIFALETDSGGGILPDGARWLDHSDLAALANPRQREALARWFAEAAGGAIPDERAPWERPGWFATAISWIEQQLAEMDRRRSGPYAQLHARAWSTVWRVPTTHGNVYFKAVTQPFAFEPPLTALLAEALPAQSPRVLAVDRERRWLLMADAGESIRAQIRATHDARLYERMLVEFAQFQVKLLPRLDQLAATGCPDLRLSRLPARFAELLADRAALLVGEPGGLTEADYVGLQALNVAEISARLAEFAIPETLVQEDCHPGHCIAGQNGFIFFDWGDSCLAHPFFSLMMGLRWGRLVLGFDAETLDTMRDAYLAQWSAYGSLERLREAYGLAWRLAPLMRALTWYRIVANQETTARWQYADYPPYWLSLVRHGENKDG